jgi:hypothetical protein
VPEFNELTWLWDTYPLPSKVQGTSFDALVQQVLAAGNNTGLRITAAPQHPYFAC